MSLIINLIILVLQILLVISAIRKLKNNYMDFSSYFIFIYAIFFIPIFWDMYLGTNVFSYAYKTVEENNISATKTELTYYNFIVFIIIVFFKIGFQIAKSNNKEKEYKYLRQNYMITQMGLLIIWFFLMAIAIKNYDGNILMFFTPSSKQIYNSVYMKTLTLVIPTLMFTLRVCRDVYLYNKIKFSVFVYVLIMLISAMPSGQRREIIEVVLYILLVLTFSKQELLIKKISDSKKAKKIFKYLFICVVLVIVVWYARVLFTQIQRGKANINNPLTVRSPIQILYGSSASGFPTMIAMHNYFENTGIPYFRNVVYVFTSFIPRSIYPNKLESLTEYLQNLYGTESNMSLFYVCDMYFTFGLLSIFASLFFGYIFAMLYKSSINKSSIRYKYIAFIMFSKIILLYKNGFAEYIIKMLFYLVIMSVCINFVFPKCKGENNEKSINNR